MAIPRRIPPAEETQLAIRLRETIDPYAPSSRIVSLGKQENHRSEIRGLISEECLGPEKRWFTINIYSFPRGYLSSVSWTRSRAWALSRSPLDRVPTAKKLGSLGHQVLFACAKLATSAENVAEDSHRTSTAKETSSTPKDHGEGRSPLYVDQVLTDGRYKKIAGGEVKTSEGRIYRLSKGEWSIWRTCGKAKFRKGKDERGTALDRDFTEEDPDPLSSALHQLSEGVGAI
ncbi:hypothetical protein BDR22DRAFT_822001 [Usnea florida]